MTESLPTADLSARLRRVFAQGRTRDLDWRRRQLRQLRRFLVERVGEIIAALANDLGKPAFETRLTETGFVIGEIDHALRHLSSWSRPKRAPWSWRQGLARAEVQAVPFGTVLILAPWNYPVQLALAPLVSALAAGNCVILKPSELAAASSALLARRLPEYLDREAVAVVTGGPETAAALVALPPDYIFYTGGAAVGRKVMAAAATTLTPVTLELGGKSPCLVDDTADITVAARRLVWGKFLNAGQTCVAPDYVLAERRVLPALTRACVRAVREFWGNDPKASPDYGRIISDRHFTRLQGLLCSGTVVIGGDCEAGERYISPTILSDVAWDSPVMQEEIFGPILPILPVESLDEAVVMVNSRPAPLALYLFSRSREARARVLAGTRSGGVGVNDVIMQVTHHGLPLGGVGESGMGVCHGHAGFATFSQQRSVLEQTTLVDPSLRYPPYGRLAQWLLAGKPTSGQ
ncbi:MAG: aldehyde dehydrogenase family protein [Lentisphaeria bacterium]|nr:aldehyde dehydrogenase family protein [Lentisphaeria bacterium]